MEVTLENLLATFVLDGESEITQLHPPFMVDNEIVLWADALSMDDIVDSNGDRYKGLVFIAWSVKIWFSIDGGNLHLSDFYRIDTTGPPPRGFATSLLKKCIHVAAKHSSAYSISVSASGTLLSDAPLEEELMETMRSVDLDTLFAHAMQIPCYISNLANDWDSGDFDYINNAMRFVVARMMNLRLVAYYEKLGFRVCDRRRDDLDAVMDLPVRALLEETYSSTYPAQADLTFYPSEVEYIKSVAGPLIMAKALAIAHLTEMMCGDVAEKIASLLPY